MPSPPEPAGPRPPSRDYLAQEEARRLLTTANIHLRRGQTAEAERAVRDALVRFPQDAAAQEMLGDVHLAQGRFDEARAAYKAALQSEPGRATAEARLARTSLQQSEALRRETLGVPYAASGASLLRSGDNDPGRRTRLAIFSALLPGLGQIFGGEFLKGGIIAGIYLLGWLLFSLTAAHSAVPGPGRTMRLSLGALGGVPLFALLLLTLDWLYSVVDAAVLSGHKH